MKKVISYILILAIVCICFAACSNDKNDTSSASASPSDMGHSINKDTGSTDMSQQENSGISSKPGTGADTAEEAAQLYLLSAPYSYSALVQELKNEGFTEEQAVAAADSCNADWNEQAVRAGKEYLKEREFNEEGLTEQLKYDGFSDEEAAYGASHAISATKETEKSDSDKEDMIQSVE